MRLTLTVEELKSKIKNIRTTYNREASKVAKSKKSGAGTDELYTPQLRWSPVADRFLKPVIEGRNRTDNIVKKKMSPKKTAERARIMNPPTRTVDRSVLEAVNRLETLAQNIRQDEFDTFGLRVASQLRCLSLANAIVCQTLINNYLSEERLKILNAQYLPICRPTSSFSDYTRYTSTPKAEATTSRNQASTLRNQRNTSTSEASTSENHLQNEEDYFASCLLTEENTGQYDILSQAIRSSLDDTL
ncbi:uncharacterized protein LOC108913601 [Anoplophora glabripennis]|uniref:uncharacterized protein LOC108913601 n=1 Tax=Anoplophora glabripennis TaxID=217634 RepID=UPI0008752881|nr:uncharacterized protein LOC108913601 [Anoplophora glabripennis]